MAGEGRGQHGIGADDAFGILARTPGRSPLQELNDFPFFRPDGDAPPPPWALRHAGALLSALALTIAAEGVVLGLLLR